MTAQDCGIVKVSRLGLFAYRRPRSCNKWHLPVCSTHVRGKLMALRPNHPNNWEDVDLGGCPTICYVLTGRELRAWSKLPFTAVWGQFEDRIGKGPAKEFFHDMWVRNNNIRAKSRNRWEEHHGGIRTDRFNRGPSIRQAASSGI